jgi:hypothetical protein
MTRVSWFASVLALTACADRYRIQPSRTPDLVNAYTKKKESVVWYQGKRYPIRAAQDPKLRVLVQRDGAREDVRASLDQVRANRDSLEIRGRRQVRLSQIAAAELEIDGEPPGPLPTSQSTRGDRPLSTRRLYLGGQLGGSSYVQAIVRLRLVGPLLVDVGAGGFVLPPGGAGGCASVGGVIDVPVYRRWSLYGGGGVGAGSVFGGDGGGAGTTSTAYQYARVGVALRLGIDQLVQMGIDGGFWRGRIYQQDDRYDEATDAHQHTESTRQFLWPMAGLFIAKALM